MAKVPLDFIMPLDFMSPLQQNRVAIRVVRYSSIAAT
jgi:hypothetical protein